MAHRISVTFDGTPVASKLVDEEDPIRAIHIGRNIKEQVMKTLEQADPKFYRVDSARFALTCEYYNPQLQLL